MLKEFLLLAITAFSLSQALHVDTKVVDVDFVTRQKKIFELYMFVDQPKLMGAEWYEVGRNFDFESHIDMFHDKMVVREFMYRFRLGMLRRDALFSIFHKEHREELRILFKLFYNAKDFTTFYKTACWCRHYMNRGMFITALNTAVMYRSDCKGIMLPPMYEVYPYLFFDSTIIREAQRLKMMTGTTKMMTHMDPYVVDTNMTHIMRMCDMTHECKLDYFTHDVDLNNYYYYIRNIFPFWITLKDLDLPTHIRGEFYYYIHQQLLARYNMERYSLGLYDVEDLDVNKKIIPGYYSNLMYDTGVMMPSRDFWTNIPFYKYKYIKEINTIEKRILDAIDSGMIMDKDGKFFNIYTTEGLNILGNLIEGNYDTCNMRLYESIELLYRNLLGVNYDCHHKNCYVPSVLQSYMTTLRDPVFYRICKIIMNFFIRYKCHLPVYTTTELGFNGVAIEDIKVEKMVTYMDKCEYFINNVLMVDNLKEGLNWNLKARKWCLNYKPFNYEFMVKSDKVTKGVMRIFLGPAFDKCTDDRMCLYKYWYNFVELDRFMVDLNVGMNTINRLSTDCAMCQKQKWTGDMIYKKLHSALDGTKPFTMEKFFGFPMHLYLPKGRVGGMKYKLFVVITPIEESKFTVFDLPMFGKMMYDNHHFGFPLDRPLMPWMMELKNFFMRDVVIYHMEDTTYMKEMMYHYYPMVNNMMHKDMHHGMMYDDMMFKDKMMYNDETMMHHDMHHGMMDTRVMDDTMMDNKMTHMYRNKMDTMGDDKFMDRMFMHRDRFMM